MNTESQDSPLINGSMYHDDGEAPAADVVVDDPAGEETFLVVGRGFSKDISSQQERSVSKDKPSFTMTLALSLQLYLATWTEDGIGMLLGIIFFILTTACAMGGKNIQEHYATSSEWPLGGVIAGIVLIVTTHWVQKKPLVWEAYCAVLVLAVAARSLGNYHEISKYGLSASLWGILFGVLVRSMGLVINPGILNGEFFVKVGVVMLAMDFQSVISIGLPGLLVAWLDTIVVLSIGTYIGIKVFKLSSRDALVVAGATSICGSSAATAISASIHPKGYKDQAAQMILAIMGIFNAPLMPLMPLLKTLCHVNSYVIGAWIGGSIDSTGQVAASAQMGGDSVLKSAIVVKMAQNILIGPLCVVFTAYFQKSLDLSILVSRFPLFVVGFVLTSAAVTTILHTDHQYNDMKDLVVDNAWCVSEWFTLIGFVIIGLTIDFKGRKDRDDSVILWTYLIVQTIDLCTTFGWSFLAFKVLA